MQRVSVPRAWIVAAVAAAAGAAIGAATVTLQERAVSWQVGGFRPGNPGESGRVPGGAAGTVHVTDTVHDFGTVGAGGSGAYEFLVTNAGDGPLRLTRGATSCTCTIADFESDATATDPDAGGTKTVPPGASTRVTLQWKGRGPGGPFRQQATILTDDPRRPEIIFVVEGTVVPTSKAVPETILFPRLTATTGDIAAVRIFAYGDEPPHVERCTIENDTAGPAPDTGSDDVFKGLLVPQTSPLDPVEVAAEPGATGGLLLTVEARPGLPLGPLRARVTLTVRMPDEVVIEIPVAATVTGDLSVVAAAWDRGRQALVLGTVSGRRGLRTQAFVMARGPDRETVRLTVREVVPETLRVIVGESSEVGTGSAVRIPLEIVVPPGSRPANHLCSELGPAGRIVFNTGHPDSPTLTIPVCIAIGP
jgi:hypothetical protein